MNNTHDYMGNSRSNSIHFLKKERSGHARKNIYIMMSLFNLHFSYLLLLVRFTSRGFKELQLIFPFCYLGWAQLNSSVSSGVCWALNVQNGFLTPIFDAQNCSAFTSVVCQKSWRLTDPSFILCALSKLLT